MVFSDASLMSSPSARALSALITDLASDWTSKMNTRNEVDLVFAQIQHIMSLALSKVATAWNTSHDVIRVLPSELQEACFSSLSVPEKAGLSFVCSHWRLGISSLHGIWSSLDIRRWDAPLDALLARSGQLPLDLVIDNDMNLTKLHGILRPHAHRLRSLKLGLILSARDAAPVLHYPVPILEELAIESRHSIPVSLSHMSTGNAPQLRALSLTSVAIPSSGVVLGRVTKLTLSCVQGGLDHLHQTFPALEHLRIDGGWMKLPVLPACAPLRTLEVRDSQSIGVKSVVQRGYSHIERVTIWSKSAYDISSAADLLPQYPSTLQERADHETTLTMRPGTRTLQFIVWPGGTSILQDLLCESGNSFRALGRLALPATVRPWSYHKTEAILLAHTVADLPALHTIAIACAVRRPSAQTLSIFACVEGTVRAPGLARVEVVPVAGATHVERVKAVLLAAFIREALVCDDRGALEVFVDTENGARLSGDLDTLRACVGKLVI